MKAEQMSFPDFERTLAGATPPAGLGAALVALWLDAKGDWDAAHAAAQAVADADGAWVHAYLHRKEGDEANAGYWYRRAGKSPASGPLDAEWRAIATALLAKRG